MICYKPYKRKAAEWSVDQQNSRTLEDGREIFCVGIGQKIITDDITGEQKVEEITEDIYKDILVNYFGDNEQYSIKVAVGKTPSLVITYGGNLVIHNEYIPAMVEKINKVIPQLDRKLVASAIANFTLNERSKESLSMACKEIVSKINHICGTNYPSELIMICVRTHFLEKERTIKEKEEEIYYMTNEELMHKISSLLFSESNSQKAMDPCITELMYRFVKGDIYD